MLLSSRCCIVVSSRHCRIVALLHRRVFTSSRLVVGSLCARVVYRGIVGCRIVASSCMDCGVIGSSRRVLFWSLCRAYLWRLVVHDRRVVGSFVIVSYRLVVDGVSYIVVSCCVVASTSRRRIVVVVSLRSRFVVVIV